MGAFYLCSEAFTVPERVLGVFRSKGFADPTELRMPPYKLLVWGKIGMSIQNHITFGSSQMIVIGSCFFKGSDYQENLRAILIDYLAGALKPERLSGTFILLFHDHRGLFFISDRAGSQNVFIDDSLGVASNSFLGIVASRKSRHLNNNACRETILTGNLIGPDTVFSEIKRFERSINSCILGFRNLDPFKYDTGIRQRNYQDTVDDLLYSLNDLFFNKRDLLQQLGVLSGLTGGLDSRLLYFLIRSHISNYSIYSTYRKNSTPELQIANKLVQACGDGLESPIFRYPADRDTQELQNSMRRSMYFNDGLIRAHQYWIEEIKSLDYLRSLYRDRNIGFSGVGGEQYRNNEYLKSSHYNMRNWIRHELLIKCPDTDAFRPIRDELAFYLKDKICGLLDQDPKSKRISYLGIKRYYNEIWNPSTRTLRNNIENQFRLFFSPFTDAAIAQAAYHAGGHVQKGFRLELDLIKQANPALAGIPTDYGFSPADKILLKHIAHLVAKNLLGMASWSKIKSGNKDRANKEFEVLRNQHRFLDKCVAEVQALHLVPELNPILADKTLYHMVIELGMLLSEFNECISFN